MRAVIKSINFVLIFELSLLSINCGSPTKPNKEQFSAERYVNAAEIYLQSSPIEYNKKFRKAIVLQRRPIAFAWMVEVGALGIPEEKLGISVATILPANSAHDFNFELKINGDHIPFHEKAPAKDQQSSDVVASTFIFHVDYVSLKKGGVAFIGLDKEFDLLLNRRDVASIIEHWETRKVEERPTGVFFKFVEF
jgi:hypothetical protein